MKGGLYLSVDEDRSRETLLDTLNVSMTSRDLRGRYSGLWAKAEHVSGHSHSCWGPNASLLVNESPTIQASHTVMYHVTYI